MDKERQKYEGTFDSPHSPLFIFDYDHRGMKKIDTADCNYNAHAREKLMQLNIPRKSVFNTYETFHHIMNEPRISSEVFSNSIAGVMIADEYRNIRWVNDAFTKTTGYTGEEVMGKRPSILKSGIHSSKFYADMWNSILSTGRWQGEVLNQRKNGELYEEWLSIVTVLDDKGGIECFVGILSDITDIKYMNRHRRPQ